MSVAFRRESDEEHKEPRFELPLPPGPNLVTARGPALLAAKVAEIEGAVAAADDAAREALKRELRYWHTRAATAEVAPLPEAGVAGIGTRVRIRMGGKERSIEIVGHDEADTSVGRLSFQAPLARALIGAEEGERVDFGGRAEAIELLGVEPIA